MGFHLGIYLRIRTKTATLDDMEHIKSYFTNKDVIDSTDMTFLSWESCFKKVASSTAEENFSLLRVEDGISIELANSYNFDIEEQYESAEVKGLKSLPLNLIKFHERLFGKVPYCFGFGHQNIRGAMDITDVKEAMREFTMGNADGEVDPEILAGLMKMVVKGGAVKVSAKLTPLVAKCIDSDILTARQFGFIELIPLLHIYLYGTEVKAQPTSLTDAQVLSFCSESASSFNLSTFCYNSVRKFPCETSSCNRDCGVCKHLI